MLCWLDRLNSANSGLSQLHSEPMQSFEEAVSNMMTAPWNYPGLVERHPDDVWISFSCNHSLKSWVSWTIFLSDMKFFVRHIQWVRRMDRIELAGHTPSTFGSESALRKPHAEAIVDTGHSLFGQEGQRSSCGLRIDGVYCSVFLPHMAAPFSWIVNGPDTDRFDHWLGQVSSVANQYLPPIRELP